MKTQHTPGPWKIIARTEHGNWITIRTTNEEWVVADIAKDCPKNLENPKEEDDASEANARLIAAAPELLGALSELLSRLPVGFTSRSWGISAKTGEKNKTAVDNASAAIAKATGGAE